MLLFDLPGYYMYIEATGEFRGDVARLTSPVYDNKNCETEVCVTHVRATQL